MRRLKAKEVEAIKEKRKKVSWPFHGVHVGQKKIKWLNKWANLTDYPDKSKDFKEGYRRGIRDVMREIWYDKKDKEDSK